MAQYLEEAAGLLRKAATTNEQRNASSGFEKTLNQGREQIAAQFAVLAAIETGQFTPDMARSLVNRITA